MYVYIFKEVNIQVKLHSKHTTRNRMQMLTSVFIIRKSPCMCKTTHIVSFMLAIHTLTYLAISDTIYTIQKQNCDGTKLVHFCSRVKNRDVVLGGLMGAHGGSGGLNRDHFVTVPNLHRSV